jgi:hypothetical protein
MVKWLLTKSENFTVKSLYSYLVASKVRFDYHHSACRLVVTGTSLLTTTCPLDRWCHGSPPATPVSVLTISSTAAVAGEPAGGSAPYGIRGTGDLEAVNAPPPSSPPAPSSGGGAPVSRTATSPRHE